MKKLLLTSIAVVLTTGCGFFGLTQEQCMHMDWFQKGRTDAISGGSLSSFDEYSKRCGKFEITADKESYTDGFNQGLKQFCTYERGKSFGYNHGIYHNTCPLHLEKEFMRGYKSGRKKRKIENLERKQKDLEARIENIEQREENVSGFRKYL